MKQVDVVEDVSFILYLTPLIASAIYALYLWIPAGLSAALPKVVYLSVTKDPYLFLTGLAAVCVAVLLEVYMSPSDSRLKRLAGTSHQMRILATASVVFSILSIWSVSGYSADMEMILTVLLEGRYALIYPLILLLTAFLLTANISLSSLKIDRITEDMSTVLIIASPLVFFLLWRLNVPWELTISTTLLILAAGLLLPVYRAKGRRQV